MPKLPSFRPREIEKILLKSGFKRIRQTGSHRTYYNKSLDKVVTVSFHSRDIPKGTLRSIIKQSGLSVEMFIKK